MPSGTYRLRIPRGCSGSTQAQQKRESACRNVTLHMAAPMQNQSSVLPDPIAIFNPVCRVRRVALGNVKSNGAAGGGEVEQHSCLFQAHVFYTFPSSLSVPQWTELCGVISDNGGLVAARANNRVWHACEVMLCVHATTTCVSECRVCTRNRQRG